MDSEANQSDSSTVHSATKDDSDVDMIVVSKSEAVAEDSENREEQLESAEDCQIVSSSILDQSVTCETSFDEDNTQIITGDKCVQENDNSGIENAECGSEVLNSNSEKDEIMETQVFGTEEKDCEHHNMSIEEIPAEELDQFSAQMESSEKLDDTVVVESDEEKKPEASENSQTVVEETKVDNVSSQGKTEELENDIAPGNESQASTIDFMEIEAKIPNSPEDLFASQSPGNIVKQNTENSLVDYEDFIPSSLPSQREKGHDEVNPIESASVSTPQKRKIDKDDEECNEAKVPRLEVPLVTTSKETSDNKIVGKGQKEIELIENNEAEATVGSRETIKTDQKVEKSTSQEKDLCLTNEKVDKEKELLTDEKVDKEMELLTNEKVDKEKELLINEKVDKEKELLINEKVDKEKKLLTNEKADKEKEFLTNEKVNKEKELLTIENVNEEKDLNNEKLNLHTYKKKDLKKDLNICEKEDHEKDLCIDEKVDHEKDLGIDKKVDHEKDLCIDEKVDHEKDLHTDERVQQEKDLHVSEKVDKEGNDPINEDSQGESSKGIMTPKDSRKSVEIIFSSFENADKQDTFVKPQSLPVVPEENGEDYEEDSQMENFHLQMSLSPSQVTQSFTEPEVSNDDKEVVAKLDASKTTSNGDTNSSDNLSNSHHNSKPTSELNCYSLKEASQKIPDTVTVDDSVDVQVSSPEGKNSNDIVVLKTVGNCSTSKSDDSDVVDVTVVLDKTADSDKSTNSESTKHKDMNGTLLKRKRPESDEDAENLVVLDEVEQNDIHSEGDSRKRSRFVNLPTDEKSTPDIALLVSNKGKFQSTPNDSNRATPMNASISTVEPMSLSAGKDSSFPLRVVKRTYALHVKLHVHDDLQQVQTIEMVQCQNMEDYMLTNTLARDTSGGSAADISRNSSPSSVMSLGPFPLKTQSWRLSTSSTSTTSSSHSNLGVKSKSDDGLFTAPMKPALSRNNRLRNIQYSSEFERDLFELAERTIHIEDTESKLSSFLTKPVVPPVNSSAPTTTEVLDEMKDMPHTKTESQETVVETPKSTKKLSRGSRNTRNRTLVSKTIKEVSEEDISFQPTPEKDAPDAGESSNSQKKSRKPPARASKRTGRSTPSTPVTNEETKSSTPTAPSSGRARRNRADQAQPEKTDSSSQESSHVYEWNSGGCFTKLMPEAPVFARWSDKKYYPGRIKEKLKDGRWVIEFDDKTVKPLKEEFIIPINILTKGQIVFAYDGDEYEQGIIVEFKLKDGEVHYGVDLDSGRKLFVSRSRLFMSEDQARLLQEGMDPKSPTTSSPALTTVSCDNIVHHKRPRSTRVLFGNASPSVSGVGKTTKLSDSNDKGPTLVLDEVVGVDPEVPSSFPESLHSPSGRGKGPGRIKSKSRTPRRNTPANHTIADTQELNKLHETLGPIPEKGSKMFSGKCFLLTHSVYKPIDNLKINPSLKSGKKSDQKSSSEESAFSDDGFDSKIPFVKEHLKQQLEGGGGIVYESFEDVPEEQYQNCYLVTNRPSLTAKYILSLANGIKIIQHRWVIEEARGSSVSLASARCAAGWDLEGKCYVPPEATVRTRKQKPLNKKEVGIVNESQTFVKFWERILELMGANVRHISPGSPEQDRQFSGVDVILTDSTCPPEVQDRAREWSIPLVSTVWVTQSLINWRIRPYTGHPHYRYDYCTSD
ncbi:Tumor suppressor p53-binding protein 1 [Gryllus bimaculatus]|nr:Tumor suppressor p53-binding protein 1 [Gryllus bimaculatus]